MPKQTKQVDELVQARVYVEPLRVSPELGAHLIAMSRSKFYKRVRDGKIKLQKEDASSTVTLAELRSYVANHGVEQSDAETA